VAVTTPTRTAGTRGQRCSTRQLAGGEVTEIDERPEGERRRKRRGEGQEDSAERGVGRPAVDDAADRDEQKGAAPQQR